MDGDDDFEKEVELGRERGPLFIFIFVWSRGDGCFRPRERGGV